MPEKFSPEYLLDCLNIKSELEALALADKVEASMHTWQRKAGRGHSKSSWDLVKDFTSETDHQSDKNAILAERAKSLLICLKQRFPELSQTRLDIFKIQYSQVWRHFYTVSSPTNVHAFPISIIMSIFAVACNYLS